MHYGCLRCIRNTILYYGVVDVRTYIAMQYT